MSGYPSVLVGTDGSGSSCRAVDGAAEVARRAACDVHTAGRAQR